MQSNKPLIVACIPAFNEEKTIASVIIKAQRHVDKVIVCDDGSMDMTAEIAKKLGADVVSHGKNLGYGAALATLFEKAREENADIMVIVDGDGQHNPDDIPRLIEPIIGGEADIVIGSRFLGEGVGQVPRYRRAGIKIITKITDKATYNELTDAQSGFRAYNKKAIISIKPSEMGMGASAEILIKAHKLGLKVKEIPVKISYGKDVSTHNPIYHGIDVVLSIVKHLSIRHPLLFYGVPGFILIMIALVFWIWTLQIFTATRQVVTNITLVAIGATMVGLTLLTTAIILWVLASLIREKV